MNRKKSQENQSVGGEQSGELRATRCPWTEKVACVIKRHSSPAAQKTCTADLQTGRKPHTWSHCPENWSLCLRKRHALLSDQEEGGIDGARSQEREEQGAHVQGTERTKESPEDYHSGCEIRKQLLSSLDNQSDLLLNEGNCRTPQTPVAVV